MISVLLNGESLQITADTALSEAMAHWGYTEKPVAVAINDNFVARNQYRETLLTEGARIDVVSPMQGG